MVPVRRFFLLAFAVTWGIGGIGLVLADLLPGRLPFSASNPLYYVAGYSVSVLGVLFVALYDGRDGLRRLGRRLNPLHPSTGWALVVCAAYGAITTAAVVAETAYHHPAFMIPRWSTFAMAMIKDPGPIGEEFGWRGFALPRLLERHSPIQATVRLGLVHTAWHLPLFFISSLSQARVSFPLFTVGVMAIAVFDTALYFRTRANLLLAILVHVLANALGGFAIAAGALNFFFLAEGAAAIIVVLTGGLKTTCRHSAPAATF